MHFSTGRLTKAGYLIKTHGFDGRLKLAVEPNIKIQLKEPIFLFLQEKPVPFFFTQIEGRNPSIIALEGVDSYEKAQELSGSEIFVQREVDDNSVANNLIGYTIIDHHLGDIGKIHDFVDHGHQQLALINFNNQECMIPMVDAIFVDVNHKTKVISAELPDGLLNLSVHQDTDEEE